MPCWRESTINLLILVRDVACVTADYQRRVNCSTMHDFEVNRQSSQYNLPRAGTSLCKTHLKMAIDPAHFGLE